MIRIWFARVMLAVLLFTGLGCQQDAAVDDAPVQATAQELEELTAEFQQRIEKVADGVWMAIGYGLANSILIEGDNGLIVIDTMETLQTGAAVAAEFRKLSDKPLAAIIYTHNHADHVFGAQAFIDVLAHKDTPVEVLAHDKTAELVYRVVSEFRPIISARSYRMFGTQLGDGQAGNEGIGLELKIYEDSEFAFVKPTRTFESKLDVEIAGEKLTLIHAPGETDDQLFVWNEERKLLAAGDNLYRAFPNLYTIRGTPHRSLKRWANSLDLARSLPVELLVPSHGSAIEGRDLVWQTLTDYRDAIRYVHDQTVRYMNLGYTPDEAVEVVKLPQHLRESPYLRELYGKVEWSVRAVYAGNLGWFDGNPTTLRPQPPGQHALRMQELAGGFDGLTTALSKASQAGQHQWVLELTDTILRLDSGHKQAREARIAALTARGNAATNPNERHYYLSSVLELRDDVRFKPLSTSSDRLLSELPMTTMFDSMSVTLRAEDTLSTNLRVGLSFTDSGERYTLWVRRGVLEVRQGLIDDLDLHAKVDSLAFKKLLTGQRNALVALANDYDFPVGNTAQFAAFLNMFKSLRKTPEPAPFAAIDCCD
ncbi:MAG: alkyl sulfatase dimerization domain-containing protein [Gammaproteobacteria bacterium]